MSDDATDINSLLAHGVKSIVACLARILIQHGVSYGTFDQWCRKAFVKAAENEIIDQQKRVTTVNVAALSGLSRKEATRLRGAPDEVDLGESINRYNRPLRMISGWRTDADFLDDSGEPLVLKFSGTDNSFTELARRYSGGMSPLPMMELLKNAGTVKVIDDEVKLLTTTFVPEGAERSSNILRLLALDVPSLVNTFSHNLKAGNEDRRLFQRKVFNFSLKPEHKDEFQKLSSEKGLALLLELNDWLKEREVEDYKQDKSEYVSFNMFYSDYFPKDKSTD